MGTSEEIQLRRDIVLAILPTQRWHSIHNAISAAAEVVNWVKTGN